MTPNPIRFDLCKVRILGIDKPPNKVRAAILAVVWIDAAHLRQPRTDRLPRPRLSYLAGGNVVDEHLAHTRRLAPLHAVKKGTQPVIVVLCPMFERMIVKKLKVLCE